MNAGSARDSLEALDLKWAGAYWLAECDGGFEATRKHAPCITLTAPALDELDQIMAEDWSSW